MILVAIYTIHQNKASPELADSPKFDKPISRGKMAIPTNPKILKIIYNKSKLQRYC